MPFMDWMAVFIGGGLGSAARFFVFRNMLRIFPNVPVFISTFIVNAIGCFLIGYLFALTAIKNPADHFRYFWIIGFLGGLTTFSTLGLDIFQLIQEKSILYAASYFMIHGIICIALVWAGYSICSVR